MANPFRNLPSVTQVLEAPGLATARALHSSDAVVAAIRSELDAIRRRISAGECVDGEADPAQLAATVARRLDTEHQPKLVPVINATGIVLHTNLGRAPMAESAAQAAYQAARGYLNLELDLATGKRSSRQDAIREWVCRLVGAESATAVNNNAAATVIALRALAAGKEVIVSRGQLVEIGGSFRIPDIMRVSGATLKEVGATNITRIGDYEKAITDHTAVLLRVHCSNYRVVGHTEAATLEEMIALARRRNLLVIDDIGSGALIDYARWGLADEPLAKASLAAGADLVLFSGDKLLGGPQAGILAGRKELVQRIEKDPLMRAFRLDKMTLAALEATLRVYLNEAAALASIPILQMLETPLAALRERAAWLADQLRSVAGVADARPRDDVAYVGGGSLPDQQLPTVVVEVVPKEGGEADLAQRLRTATPAVMARVQDGKLLFDLRTVFAEQLETLVMAVAKATGASA